MLLALVVGAAIAAVALVVVGSPFAKHSVTREEIQNEVAKRPRGGKVQVVLCNQIVIPTESGKPAPGQTWTCDTYLGPTKADAQNGPSYEVKVDGGEIKSIRRVPTH